MQEKNPENTFYLVDYPSSDLIQSSELNNFKLDEKSSQELQKNIGIFLKNYFAYINTNKNYKTKWFDSPDPLKFDYNTLFHFILDLYDSKNITSKELEILSFIQKNLIKPNKKKISLTYDPGLDKKFEIYFFKFEDILEIEKKPLKKFIYFFCFYIENINTDLYFCQKPENIYLIINRLEGYFSFIKDLCEKNHKKFQKFGILIHIEKICCILINKIYMLISNLSYFYLINTIKPENISTFVLAYEFFINSNLDNFKTLKERRIIEENVPKNNSTRDISLSFSFSQPVNSNNINCTTNSTGNLFEINTLLQYEIVNRKYFPDKTLEIPPTTVGRSQNNLMSNININNKINFNSMSNNFGNFSDFCNDEEIIKNIMENILNKISTDKKIILYENNSINLLYSTKTQNILGRFGKCTNCSQPADFYIISNHLPICSFDCKLNYLTYDLFSLINDNYSTMINNNYNFYMKNNSSLQKRRYTQSLEISEFLKSTNKNKENFGKYFFNAEIFNQNFSIIIEQILDLIQYLLGILNEIDLSYTKVSNQQQISFIFVILKYLLKYFHKTIPKKILKNNLNKKFVFIFLKFFAFGEHVYTEILLDLVYDYFIYFKSENKANLKFFIEEGIFLIENKFISKKKIFFFNFINKILFLEKNYLFDFYFNFDYASNQPNLTKELINLFCYNYVSKNYNEKNNRGHKFFINIILENITSNIKKISKNYYKNEDINFILKEFSNFPNIINKEKENNRILKDLFNTNFKEFNEKIKKNFDKNFSSQQTPTNTNNKQNPHPISLPILEKNNLNLKVVEPEISNTISQSAIQSEDLYTFHLIKYITNFIRFQPDIDKAKLGEYIGKNNDFNKKILNEYIQLFDFSEQRIDIAMRSLLSTFLIPGEAQIIDRLIDSFSKKYFDDIKNTPLSKFIYNYDSTFYLSFNIIFLNTSLHNPKISKKEKLTKENFIKTLKGIDNVKNFDEEFLSEIYADIEKSEILFCGNFKFSYTNYLDVIKLKANFICEEKWEILPNPQIIKISNLLLNLIHEKIFKDFDLLENIIGKDEVHLYNLTSIFFNMIQLANFFNLEIFKSTIINFWGKLVDFSDCATVSEEKGYLNSLYIRYNKKYINLFEFNLGGFFFYLLEKYFQIEKIKDEQKSQNNLLSDKLGKLSKIFGHDNIDYIIKHCSRVQASVFNGILSDIFQNFLMNMEKKLSINLTIFLEIVEFIKSFQNYNCETWGLVWKNIFFILEFILKIKISENSHKKIHSFLQQLIKQYLNVYKENHKIGNEKNLFFILIFMLNNFNTMEYYNNFGKNILKILFRDYKDFMNVILFSRIFPIEIKKMNNEKIRLDLQKDIKNYIFSQLEKLEVNVLKYHNEPFKQICFILEMDTTLAIQIIEDFIEYNILRAKNKENLIEKSYVMVENEEVGKNLNSLGYAIGSKESYIFCYNLILKNFIKYYMEIPNNPMQDVDLNIISFEGYGKKLRSDNNLNNPLVNNLFDYKNLFKYFFIKVINFKNDKILNNFLKDFINYIYKFYKDLFFSSKQKKNNIQNNYIQSPKKSNENIQVDNNICDTEILDNLLKIILNLIEFQEKINILEVEIIYALLNTVEIYLKLNKKESDFIITVIDMILKYFNLVLLTPMQEVEFLIRIFNFYKLLFDIDYKFFNFIDCEYGIESKQNSDFNKDFIFFMKNKENKINMINSGNSQVIHYSNNIEDNFEILSEKIKNNKKEFTNTVFLNIIARFKKNIFPLFEKFNFFKEKKFSIENNKEIELPTINLLEKYNYLELFKFSEKLNFLMDIFSENFIGPEIFDFFKSSGKFISSNINYNNDRERNLNNENILCNKNEINLCNFTIYLNLSSFNLILLIFLLEKNLFENLNQQPKEEEINIIKRNIKIFFEKFEIFLRVILKLNEERQIEKFINTGFRDEITKICISILKFTSNLLEIIFENKISIVENKNFIKNLKLTFIDLIIIDNKEIRYELRNILNFMENL